MADFYPLTEACEVCGHMAVVRVQDIQEIEPSKDAAGNLWRQHKKDGKPHYFCLERKREAVVKERL